MRPRLEIGIDCLDPEQMARFWVEALGYEGWRGDGNPYLELVSPDEAPAVYFQKVPEKKVAKNRLHLDLFTDEPEALVERLVGLGATRVGAPFGEHADDAPSEPGPSEPGQAAWEWQVMADPEKNEFCVCREGATT